MENKKIMIEKDSVQETLILPLYGRKIATELYPTLFSDPSAQQLIDRLDYDFSKEEEKSMGLMQRFGSLEVAMRQKDLSAEVREYLARYPYATVVNMGCGLDQSAENCDNGTCRIVNLDMPEVIAVRQQLIPPRDRVRNIAADLNDLQWISRIDGSQGVVFFASGVFCYFRKEQIRKIFNAMALAFPKGKLVFDSYGKLALKIMLKTFIKESGIGNVQAFFSVSDLKEDIDPWMENATVSCKPYMYGYHDLNDACISDFFRFLAQIGDRFLKMKIIRMDFESR